MVICNCSTTFSKSFAYPPGLAPNLEFGLRSPVGLRFLKTSVCHPRYRPLLRDRNNIYKPEFKYKQNEFNLNFAAGFKKMIR